LRINKHFFSSLRWKISLTYLLVIGIGFFMINLVIMQNLEKYLIRDRKIDYQKYSIQLAQLIADDYYNKDPNIFYRIQEFGYEVVQMEGESTRILILNRNGIVEQDSYQSTSLLRRDLTQDYPDVVSVLKGNSVRARDVTIKAGNPPERKRVLYAYAPITHYTDGVIGMVFLSTSLDSVETVLADIRKIITLFTTAITSSIILISFVLSGLITHPIKEMTASITRMSKGYLNQKVNITGSGEFRQMGEAFNVMSEKLEHLDHARNEFVSNASHELKTPLSAMKVLAESLLSMEVDDPAIYRDFLADINSEVDRLNAIITDLLSMVNLDQDVNAAEIRKEPVELTSLAKRTIRGMQLLADQKQIRVELFSEETVTVMGDGLKLQQVLSNIIDNGIKYTPDGGRVTVEVYRAPDYAVMKVSDTGIGIPQEDMAHIFDRFFRVDKARSRSTGGTGLGLSIANRIVMMHQGFIRVSSEEGKGTTFYVELPYGNVPELTD